MVNAGLMRLNSSNVNSFLNVIESFRKFKGKSHTIDSFIFRTNKNGKYFKQLDSSQNEKKKKEVQFFLRIHS